MDFLKRFFNKILKVYKEKQCGKILDIKILKDKEGKPKGMAMVEFENRESVLKAIDEFSGKQLNENIIRVEKYDIEKYEKKRDNRNARYKYKIVWLFLIYSKREIL